jgi:hypothetical protein
VLVIEYKHRVQEVRFQSLHESNLNLEIIRSLTVLNGATHHDLPFISQHCTQLKSIDFAMKQVESEVECESIDLLIKMSRNTSLKSVTISQNNENNEVSVTKDSILMSNLKQFKLYLNYKDYRSIVNYLRNISMAMSEPKAVEGLWRLASAATFIAPSIPDRVVMSCSSLPATAFSMTAGASSTTTAEMSPPLSPSIGDSVGNFDFSFTSILIPLSPGKTLKSIRRLFNRSSKENEFPSDQLLHQRSFEIKLHELPLSRDWRLGGLLVYLGLSMHY